MSKKIIEQIKVVKYFGKGEKEPTVIDNPSAIELTTVAKAIDPEYQKVIDQNEILQECNEGLRLALENQTKQSSTKLKAAVQRNAKLVEACTELMASYEKYGHLLRFDVNIIRESLQNNKKIENGK